MAKVDSNTVSLAYAREAEPGVKPATGWTRLEPNEISQFGATVATTPREPISDDLQRRKGTPTDLDSTTAFAADITVDGLWDWLEAAVFARSAHADLRDLPVTAVATADDSYAVADIGDGATPGKLAVGTLLWAHGFAEAANNGLKSVDADIADNAVKITVAEDLADQAAAANAVHGRVSLAGFRVPAATGKTWSWAAAGSTATLAIEGAVETATLARILRPGQMVHFGSVAAAGGALGNGLFVAGAANAEAFGFARVRSIAEAGIVFDRVDAALRQGGAEDAANALDILAGDFVHNVPRGDPAYIQRPHAIELTSPDLFGAGRDGHEYAVGQVIGSLALNFPLNAMATMTVSFVGQDTEKPVDAANRQEGAAGARAPLRKAAFNTAADFARLRIVGADEAGLTTDFKSLTLTINPQTSPEKVLGRLGARFLNRGNLLVDTEAQVIFSSAAVIEAIRENRTLGFETVFGNGEGVFAIEIPSQTLGGGGREYPANQAVAVATTGQSFGDARFGTSIHVSFFPVPIPTGPNGPNG